MRQVKPTHVFHSAGRWRLHALVARGGSPDHLPIVLVHGFGVSSRYWHRLAERLAVEHPVWAPDLPGHGPSEQPPVALDVPELAATLRRWMDAVGLARAALIGNSMGCQVAAELAVAHPDRVDSLVLCGPTVDPAARSAPRQILRLLLSAPAEDPRLAPVLVSDYLRAGIGRLRTELGHMLRHRIEERLPEIGAPVLLLRGTWDRIVPRHWARHAVRLLPNGSLVEVPRAGHAAHYTRSAATAERVLAFLRARPSPPPTGALRPARAAPGPDVRG